MTAIEQEGVPTLGPFGEFTDRLFTMLPSRVPGEVVRDASDRSESSHAAICALATGGALVARVAMTHENSDATACLFWIGAAGVILDEPGKAIESLSDSEVETLDQSLRLYVEEGGEEDLPFEWSKLERLTAEEVGAVLREAGVPDPCALLQVGAQIGDVQFAFLFAAAPHAMTVGTATVAFHDAQLIADAASVPQSRTASDSPIAASSAVAASSATSAPATDMAPNLRHLLDVKMPLTVRLGSTKMNLGEILRLTQGSIVELDQREEAPLEVLANGHVIARGEVVVVDERFGLRITEIGSSAERIRASA